ncbi:MAG TPA: hypothetical protein VJ999_13380 [Candidatus Sulfotelmatobacter sp.]|nr:hypothetical protein [Candidatus Sulfotelmatobacter sp.]
MAENLGELPKRTSSDVAHTLTKAGLNLIPVVGGTVAELFGLVIAPQLEKRRDKWLEELAASINQLQEREKGFKIEELGKSEVFVSAVLQASQIALRTHEAEKLEALRNALLHIAITKPLKEDFQIFYLNLIDTFTVTHIEILRVFDKPDAHPQRRVELSNRRIITDPFVMDLNNRGLIKDSRPLAARGRESDTALVSYEWSLSDLGRGFLAFISKPYDA